MEWGGQKKEIKKVSIIDVLSYKNEYRIYKLVKTTIRKKKNRGHEPN
jgi:hypothetical protein